MAIRITVLILGYSAGVALADDSDFEAVAEIFQTHCVSCHNRNDTKGGLDLQTRESFLAGGDSGAVIELAMPDSSLLLDYVRGPEPAMPPDGPALSEEQTQKLEQWIADGSKWPDGRVLVESHLQNRSWWSLQPLPNYTPSPNSASPQTTDSGYEDWPRNEIDHFILNRLFDLELRPAPEADRRTLIRRLYFDLIGLPPTPTAIEEFIADDSPQAYERLVDQLLDSDRYGERWARHWLDVVHYADTHGYDKDKPRPNAWPYRDYVIRSFNEDKPWSRFVQEQLAGDVLFPETRDGYEALGFIAAGPWDFVGHAEVSEDTTDGKIARHLDRDDMVRATMQSFVGLTVGCAQCHDHKFDPIPQADYYRLQAVFAALDRADRSYDTDPNVGKKRNKLVQSIAKTKSSITQLRLAAAERIAQRLSELDQAIESLRNERNETTENSHAFGYHSRIEPRQDVTKWVQVDLGQQIPVVRVVLRACKDDFGNIGPGFGFPVRFRVELSNSPDFRENEVTVIADETQADFANPKLAPVQYRVSGTVAQYLRVTATRLAARQNDFNFALAELEILDAAGKNHALGAEVSSLDTIEAPPRWRRSNLTDGIYFGQASELEKLESQRSNAIIAALTPTEQETLRQLEEQLQHDEKVLESLPAPAKIYSGTIHTGKGTFRGTGHDGGKPREIYVLKRGDVNQPEQPVHPGALSVVDLQRHFVDIDANQEGNRRAALARWLTDPDNPLVWRNVVNRIWQYHFGRGIVETPNDFGRMGAKPTHPLLLDYLAVRFRDEGQSIKDLHRWIVTSSTYRQSAQGDRATRERAHAIDANNQLLWRMPRRKLEAEAVHDSVLFVSDKLDLSMYGPGYHDFVLKHPEHSPHYEYHLHDPADPQSHRRSIYRFIVRSQLQPFMSSLDCADPSILVGRRNASVTPLQSLTMLNSGLIVHMARKFASQLEQNYADTKEQIRRGFYKAIGRPPTAEEQNVLENIARRDGLANACRAIFNLNEFSFVD